MCRQSMAPKINDVQRYVWWRGVARTSPTNSLFGACSNISLGCDPVGKLKRSSIGCQLWWSSMAGPTCGQTEGAQGSHLDDIGPDAICRTASGPRKMAPRTTPESYQHRYIARIRALNALFRLIEPWAGRGRPQKSTASRALPPDTPNLIGKFRPQRSDLDPVLLFWLRFRRRRGYRADLAVLGRTGSIPLTSAPVPSCCMAEAYGTLSNFEP